MNQLLDMALYAFILLTIVLFLYKIAQYQRKVELVGAVHDWSNSKTKMNLLVIVFVLGFSILFASRKIDSTGIGGADAFNYYNFFMQATGELKPYLNSLQFEPLLLIYFYVVRIFTDSYFIAQFIYFCVMNYTITRIVRMIGTENRPQIYIPIAINLIVAMCLMRNNLSVVFGWMSLIYCTRNKYLKSLIWAFFAILAHYSAIILIIPIFVNYVVSAYKIKPKTALLSTIFLSPVVYLVVYLLGDLLLNGRYESYGFDNIGIVSNLFKLSFIVACIWSYSHNTLKNKQALRKLIIMMCVSLFVIPIQLVYSIAYRMAPFFDIVVVMLMVKLYDKENRANNAMPIILFNGYMVYTVIYFFMITCVSYGLYPLVWR